MIKVELDDKTNNAATIPSNEQLTKQQVGTTILPDIDYSEDELFNSVGSQIVEYCTQFSSHSLDRDDLSVISDSEDELFSDYDDIDSCYGEAGSISMKQQMR